MKKLIFYVIMAAYTTMAMAQQNLRDGYIITLKGDTLYGVIDYRTPAMNTKHCTFKQNGATEFTTFLPGEIDSYRFTNNGIYYISKNVMNDTGSREMVFAEYIIRGNMNLYQIGAHDMLLVDEEGNEAAFSVDKARSAKKANEVRKEIGDAWRMLSKSEKAGNMIWRLTKTRENTKKAVITYIDDVCTDGQCEVFEYQNEVTPKEDRFMHPWVKAGYKATLYKFWNDATIMGYAPIVSVGADFHINRLLKGLMANVALSFEPGKASRDINELRNEEEWIRVHGGKPLEIDYTQFDVMFGPGYQFAVNRMKMRVRCGGIYRLASHEFNYTKGLYNFTGNDHLNIRPQKEDWKFDLQYGLYAGVGFEYPLKKFSLVCDLDYIYDYNKWSKNGLSERTVVNQHGICLSAGVKF